MTTEEVRIEKLVHGGQGIGLWPDGRKVFVWNALPGELVSAYAYKKKKGYLEAVAVDILEPSTIRVEPVEMNVYLSTSPWQILDINEELRQKTVITAELFAREKIELKLLQPAYSDMNEYGYRNKMEFSFWWDHEKGICPAFHKRGSKNRIVVDGSALAAEPINQHLQTAVRALNKSGFQARPLKSAIIRSEHSGKSVSAWFVKDVQEGKALVALLSTTGLEFEVWFSNPKSPASVATKMIHKTENTQLQDTVLGCDYSYDVKGFFQVNLPVHEQTLLDMKPLIEPEVPLLDMYCGVGSIGLSLASEDQPLRLVEVDEHSIEYAKMHAEGRINTEVIHSTSEMALDYIETDQTLILDPPRAGLHSKVVERINEVKPQRILYVSCNPATQARDVALLAPNYTVNLAKVYDYFPKTPHIETLIVLDRLGL